MAKFSDKQIADVADSLFIEAPHEAELLKEVIPSLMIKVNALEGAGSSSAAEDITYDNTESGLSAEDIQAAIDEVVTMIPEVPTEYAAEDITYTNEAIPDETEVGGALDHIFMVLSEVDAGNISYDNTESSLVAENVQAAIDEVYNAIPEVPTGYDAEDITYTNVAIPSAVEVAGALDAIVDIVRGDLLSKIVATVPNSSDTFALTTDPSLIDGQIISIVPVSGAESIIVGSSIDETGVLTITLAQTQAVGDAVFNVYVQKVVPN